MKSFIFSIVSIISVSSFASTLNCDENPSNPLSNVNYLFSDDTELLTITDFQENRLDSKDLILEELEITVFEDEVIYIDDPNDNLLTAQYESNLQRYVGEIKVQFQNQNFVFGSSGKTVYCQLLD